MEAKAGSKAAKEELYNMYRPGLIHKAVINGKFDEDLFQELCKKLLICIEKFDIDRVKSYLDVTVHACVYSNVILPMLRIPNRQNLLPEVYRTEFSVQKIPTRVQ